MQGRIQDFKLGGTHLKKLRRARENCWGISCEKSRKKYYIFSILGGGEGARRVRLPMDPPLVCFIS